jgi:hypothetical protein
MRLLFCGLFVLFIAFASAQNNTSYWQQRVDYKMEIDLDVETHQYKGIQELLYTNNSPDTIYRVFYHLYFNAFQPGSEMDMRSLTIADPDWRVGDRISKLSSGEIGYIKPVSLTQEGVKLKYNVVGTILEVTLNKPILPKTSTSFNMVWNAQVPTQIRRSGRNNVEGVAYSMAQWYPKLAEYDFEGWHADPYIGREFFGVWGDFDVKITLDEDYIIGGTGYLLNEDKKGLGKKTKNKKRVWHFKAPNVHDFTWAADPDYIHDTLQVPNGPLMHFYYKGTMAPEKLDNWKRLQPETVRLMQYFSDLVGKYPYKQYSIIQGGDGGMEYGMCTLVLGEGTFEGLLKGTISHEMAHSWFQFLLANNESKYAWMDEGFATFIEYKAINELYNKQLDNPWAIVYASYYNLANSDFEQPQTTHSDRYLLNRLYSIASYYKGSVFLSQLGYLIGDDALYKSLKRYFKEWVFKHPTPNDFIRVAEKVSGAELGWYLTDWTQTTNTIDYGIKTITSEGNKTNITLERIGLMPMPIDLLVKYEDGSQEYLYIPLQMMRYEKTNPYPKDKWTVLADWTWANPNYSFDISSDKKINRITIDASGFMADVNLENNSVLME